LVRGNRLGQVAPELAARHDPRRQGAGGQTCQKRKQYNRIHRPQDRLSVGASL
jgi:hypothetical protein